MKITRFYLTESKLSHDQIRAALSAALHPNGKMIDGGPSYWIREVYDDYLIYEDERAGPPPRLYKRPYVIADDGAVTFGDATEVKVETSYEPVGESARTSPGDPAPAHVGPLLESLDADGWRWRIQVIESGTSRNGNEYPLPVLHAAAPLYNGVPVFPEHDRQRRGYTDKLGAITESVPNARGVEATFEVMRSRPDVRDDMLQAWDIQQRTGKSLFGFSHSVTKFRSRPRRPAGRVVEAIDAVESVDLVMSPAAGGRALAPLPESIEAYVADPLQEAIVNVTELLARLREGKKLSLDELSRLQESLSGEEFAAALAEGTQPQPAAAPAAAPLDTSALDEAARRAAEVVQRMRLAECKATLTVALAESNLPQGMRTAIATDFDGRIFESSELDARIQRDRQIASELAATRPTGLGAAPITGDQRDRHALALDAFFGIPNDKGVKPFRSLKEAYVAIEGDHGFSYIDGGLNRRVLAETRAWAGEDELLAESITSSTFAQLHGDSITRRMLIEYQAPMYNSWRKIVSDVVPINDFRTQRRMRMGGYGDLPTVGEGATYQNLTSPGDEEATYAISKKGGLEDLTLEMIANDDVGAVRRIPVKLGRSAARTLYKAVWVDTIASNATCTFDSVAIYHTASHANTATSAGLSAANLLTGRLAMRDQTAYGETNMVLGEANEPRMLVIPNELLDTAYRLVQSDVAVGATNNAATEPNIHRGRFEIVVVDEFTDANDWFLFADPRNVPILEVGFFNGREEPELFVQDAQNVGSAFSADKVTYKIRHIWGIGILDYRGTYRGQG